MAVYLKKDRFEELLARRNMSQVDFANMIGISETYLSMLKDSEKHEAGASPDLREKILKVLNIEFDDIFFISTSCSSENENKDTIDTTKKHKKQ